MYRWIMLFAILLALLSFLAWFQRPKVEQSVEFSTPVEEPVSTPPPAGEVGSQPNPDSEDCLTLEQLEVQPELSDEANRLQGFMVNDVVFEPYRALNRDELEAFSEQGDSAAMTMLGAMAMMRAMGHPESRAHEFLFQHLYPRPADPYEMMFLDVPSEQQREDLERAAQWFYRAAMHGRLLVLQQYAAAVQAQRLGAVELGWLTREEYDALPERERFFVSPISIFQLLPVELAPEIATGPYGSVLGMGQRHERQRPILAQAASDFQADLAAAGLPEPDIQASTAASIESMLATRLCSSEFEKYRDMNRE